MFTSKCLNNLYSGRVTRWSLIKQKGSDDRYPFYFEIDNGDGSIFEYTYDENTNGYIKQLIEELPDISKYYYDFLKTDFVELYRGLKPDEGQCDFDFVVANRYVVIEAAYPQVQEEYDFKQISIRYDTWIEYSVWTAHASGINYTNSVHSSLNITHINSTTVVLPETI